MLNISSLLQWKTKILECSPNHWIPTWSESCSVMSDSLQPHGLYSPWSSPGQNSGVGSLSLLQDIVPTLGSNPCLPHCRRIIYQLSHKRNPRILEWVAYHFSSRSSWPRNWTGVSCIAGRFFTSWATREAYNGDGLCVVRPVSCDLPINSVIKDYFWKNKS